MSDISASEYLSQQEGLSEEARQLMPWDASKCTYEMGALRQQVFVCRTHGVGICYSCSIQCHTNCDIVELFTKREFACECGTEKDKLRGEDGLRCQLRKNREPDIASLSNRYCHNFQGKFCSCDKEYDPDSDVVMLQCILGTECNEDWYHDHCILGLEDTSRETFTESLRARTKEMPPLESFDAFICWRCTKRYDHYLKRIISHPLSEKIITKCLNRQTPEQQMTGSNKKRTIEQVDQTSNTEPNYSIFLKHGYSEQLKKLKATCAEDDKLYVFLNDLVPFLLDDQPIYEPPMDDVDEGYDDELLHNALQKDFHREQAIAGISALNALKSKLADFLKPFAETGQIVKEEDIKSFFSEKD